MKRLLYILPLLITTILGVAQVQVNNAVLHNNGAVVFINGNTVNNGGTINNLGSMHFNGNYGQAAGATVLTNQAATDTIFCTGNLNIVNGTYDGSTQGGNGYQGAVAMNGSALQNFDSKSIGADNIYNLIINNTSVTGVNINGTVINENSIRFVDGLFFTSSADTLALESDGAILGTPGVGSHVNGALYREGNSSVSDLFYPIGDGIRYRPAALKSLPVGAPVPVISFEVVNGATGGAAGLGVDNIIDTRHWQGNVIKGDYQGAKIELSYGVVEGITDQTELIVAQSSTVGGTYKSIDQSGTTGILAAGTVISEFDAQQPNYVIARSANLRVNLNAFLEGSYTGTSMHDSLFTGVYGDILTPHYSYGNAVQNRDTIDMLNTYPIPNGGAQPVDVVRLTIRDVSAPTVDIDETYAWLMSDGSIRDFTSGTKPYATFSDLTLNTTTNYALVVWHRNHVPMMFEITGQMITQNTGAPVLFNMKNPVNIYGTGYKPLAGGNAGLYIGNAEQTYSPLEVNALDLYVVGNDAQNVLPNNDLIDTDVDLSGETNATDWDKTKWANDQLYYSTLP